MNMSFIRSGSKLVTLLLGITAIASVVAIVSHPAQAFEASIDGLGLWWNIVFPALLPYYIICEIIIAYGFLHVLGRWLDILAVRWFRLPAQGGHALAAGLLSGSPAGAEVAVRLRLEGRISRMHAERIVMASHFANPIFMITVVGTALMRSPELGLFIAAAHYGSLFICGPLIRYYGRGGKIESVPIATARNKPSPQSFGAVLGNSVTDTLQKLMQIGGTIIIFSVCLRLSEVLGITEAWIGIINPILSTWHIPHETYGPVLSGLLETHLGAWAITRTTSLSTGSVVALLCALAAWGGFAVHLQVRALLHPTDIRYAPYLTTRLLQSAIAFVLAVLFWDPWVRLFPSAVPILRHADWTGGAHGYLEPTLWPTYLPLSNILIVVSALLLSLLAVNRLGKR